MRGMTIAYNAISHPMQPTSRGQLEDGGCVYTNSPCPNCSVSHNSFDNDPTEYGCIRPRLIVTYNGNTFVTMS
jgi:hypothetical protein